MVSIGKAERVLFGAYLQLDCGPIGAWIVTERILGFPSGVDGNLVSRVVSMGDATLSSNPPCIDPILCLENPNGRRLLSRRRTPQSSVTMEPGTA
jgi:hypothetical protein